MAPISTLRPDRLIPGDFVDLSTKQTHPIRTLRCDLDLEPSDVTYSSRFGTGYLLPFPKSTGGFFYYHVEPSLPPIAGELRFRVTQSSDPSSFQAGHDLLRPSKRTWSRPLLQIMSNQPSLAAIRQQLLDDGLVREDLLLHCERLLKTCHWAKTTGVTLYSLDQPFLADLSRSALTFRVVGKEAIGWCHIQHLFSAFHAGVYRRPYKGRNFYSFICIIFCSYTTQELYSFDSSVPPCPNTKVKTCWCSGL